MNKVILIGRLTKDPELKPYGDGINNLAKFTLAVDNPVKKQDGEKQADFIPVVCFDKIADNLAKYMKKGSLINVVGSLKFHTYEVADGSKRFTGEVVATEIQFLEKKKEETA